MIPWLTDNMPFPATQRALSSPNGLLAAGGDLSAPRLLEAYRHGIFPWFNSGEPILWWSPDPRMVLFPGEFKISRSLGKTLRHGKHEVRCDTAFEAVMRACAAPRDGQGGTWIHEDMIAAYGALHKLGHAHSVETWLDGKLVGGLYGIAIGRMFYGESMFHTSRDASKIALAHLARQLENWQFGMIDCQMNTPHLASLGAHEIPRTEFIARLQELVNCKPVTHWQFESDIFK
jgi:leucyl/phenylalanyl-tRNA--protein transferase